MKHGSDAEAIDPKVVDWERVRLSKYLMHQHFSYQYPARIHDLRHQLMVIPPVEFGDQRRTVYSVEVSVPGEVTTTLDSFSNTVLDVRIPVVERSVEFDAWVSVERRGPPRPRILPAEFLDDARFLAVTDRTAADPAIKRAAAELRDQGAQGLELAELANAWVHGALKYVRGVTGVETNAAAALALGRGVCQDYSHLMIAICRSLGLPTLYVSGHLLGEGGTHSWVEVLLPAADGSTRAEGWSLDPTHGCRVDLTYLTVAVGRDYSDVAPTSGSYRAHHGGTLSARKDVRLTEVAYGD